MDEATTGDGDSASTACAALLLAVERGHTHKLLPREAGRFVALRHADTMPDARIDAFLVVRDSDYSWQLGFVREGLGIWLQINRYIASSLESESRDTRSVDVTESAAGAERRNTALVQHAFD
ncbi:hypothetical protein SB461_11970 [Burkholderia cenocepacia]|uniref:hypothetical protein n=1 Tax=Burkholderia cenocepacia TaxID=95486 RepID=UPI002B2565EF|nr:hypothetical protein [Burkholderia cenocepacia]MEB2607210.1 hypothetical protein [Burkholderia cenocepacia]